MSLEAVRQPFVVQRKMAPKGAIVRFATRPGLSVMVVMMMMMMVGLCTRDCADRERAGGDGGQNESKFLHSDSWS